MELAIIWAASIGSCIFALGMISAIASRRQRSRLHRPSTLTEAEKSRVQVITNRVRGSEAAMREAASGREESFAQISGNTR